MPEEKHGTVLHKKHKQPRGGRGKGTYGVIEGLQQQVDSLEEQAKKFEELSIRDSLTGLFNRRIGLAFLDKHFKVAQEIRRRKKEGIVEQRKDIDKENLVVLMLDIDHFKQVNDRFGHNAGDQALIAFGHEVKKTLRPTDILARYGGEEFIVILPETNLSGGEIAAETLRMQISRRLIKGAEIKAKRKREEKEEVVDCKIAKNITVSVGIVFLSDEMETTDDLLNAADKAMYAAKKVGRNKSAVWMGSSADPEIITTTEGEVG